VPAASSQWRSNTNFHNSKSRRARRTPVCDTVNSCECEYLDGVEAAHDAPVLHLHVRWRVSEAALVVGPCALVPRELAADVECQPTRVLDARGPTHVHGRSAGTDRRRRSRRGRRRRVDDSSRTQHRVNDSHRTGPGQQRYTDSSSVVDVSRLSRTPSVISTVRYNNAMLTHYIIPT